MCSGDAHDPVKDNIESRRPLLKFGGGGAPHQVSRTPCSCRLVLCVHTTCIIRPRVVKLNKSLLWRLTLCLHVISTETNRTRPRSCSHFQVVLCDSCISRLSDRFMHRCSKAVRSSSCQIFFSSVPQQTHTPKAHFAKPSDRLLRSRQKAQMSPAAIYLRECIWHDLWFGRAPFEATADEHILLQVWTHVTQTVDPMWGQRARDTGQ